MQFVANGDFNFPFKFIDFFNKQFYIWSHTTGALNFDGAIRFFSRLPNFAIFYISNNLVVSYFYLFFSLIVCFLAFDYFLKEFLEINSFYKRVLPVLFFCLNPIFLGNLAKVGLIIGVAMLPLILVAIKKYFKSGKISYLILIVLYLNVSLVHPFVLVINGIVSFVYFIYKSISKFKFLREHLVQLAIVFVLGLALHLYIILPLVQTGSIDKSAIVNTISSEPNDYSQLISVASTKNMFTSFTLSKEVFLDFNFFGGNYYIFYIFSVFGLYIILFSLLVYRWNAIPRAIRLNISIALGCFLMLLLISTGSVLGIDNILTFLTNLPAGWIFRSPLKWQLYIPLALYSILAMLLDSVSKRGFYKYIIVFLVITFLGTNGYLLTEIYNKLLVPKKLDYFESLGADYFQSRVIMIKNKSCNDLLTENGEINLELNQMVQFEGIQFKVLEGSPPDSVYLNSFDYVIYCGLGSENVPNTFKLAWQSPDVRMVIFKNTIPKPTAYFSDDVELVEGSPEDYSYINESSSKALIFSGVVNDEQLATAHQLSDNYELALFKSADVKIDQNKLVSTINTDFSKEYTLYENISQNGQAKYKKVSVTGLKNLNSALGDLTLKDISQGNILEGQGIQAEDCFNYDNTSLSENGIKTSIVSGEIPDDKALELEAQKHLGCIQFIIPGFDTGSDYLISFDYNSISGRGPQLAYYSKISGNSSDPQLNINQKSNLPLTQENTWYSYREFINGTDFYDNLSIFFYAPTDEGSVTKFILDKLKIYKVTKIPEAYLRTDLPPKKQIASNFTYINPTYYTGSSVGLSDTRLLAFSETYNPNWKVFVAPKDSKDLNWFEKLIFEKPGYEIPEENHSIVNEETNGWWIDPSTFPEYLQNPNGEYKIVLEFWPQRYFYLGLLVSGATFAGCIGYLIYDWRRRALKKKKIIVETHAL